MAYILLADGLAGIHRLRLFGVDPEATLQSVANLFGVQEDPATDFIPREKTLSHPLVKGSFTGAGCLVGENFLQAANDSD
jgi:hypothetical protein